MFGELNIGVKWRGMCLESKRKSSQKKSLKWPKISLKSCYLSKLVLLITFQVYLRVSVYYYFTGLIFTILQ